MNEYIVELNDTRNVCYVNVLNVQENNQILPQEEDVSDYVDINYDVLLKRIHKTNSI
jgi:hypothetical protein